MNHWLTCHQNSHNHLSFVVCEYYIQGCAHDVSLRHWSKSSSLSKSKIIFSFFRSKFCWSHRWIEILLRQIWISHTFTRFCTKLTEYEIISKLWVVTDMSSSTISTIYILLYWVIDSWRKLLFNEQFCTAFEVEEVLISRTHQYVGPFFPEMPSKPSYRWQTSELENIILTKFCLWRKFFSLRMNLGHQLRSLNRFCVHSSGFCSSKPR